MHEPLEAPDRAFAKFRSSGDPRALASAFDATAPELLRVAAFLVPRSEVEDVLHDTFVAAIARDAAYDPSRPLLPWLLGILANEARARRRRSRMRERERHARPPAAGPDPAVVAQRREAEATFVAALETLDRDDAALLHLHLRDELTCAEIASRLGRPAGTVRTQVARAMSELRRRLPVGLAIAPGFGATNSSCLPTVRSRVLARAGEFSAVPVGSSGRILLRAFLGVAAVAVFAIVAIEPWNAPAELPPVRVAAEARVRAASSIVEAPRSAPTEILVERDEVRAAPAPWVLRGHVRSAAGVPLREAAVRFHRFRTDPTIVDVPVDRDGRYEIDLSCWRDRSAIDRTNHEFLAIAGAAGHGVLVHGAKIPLHAEPTAPLLLEHDFVLPSSATIRGRVLDASGTGVDAKVLVFSTDPEEALLVTAVAASDGTFRVAIDEGPSKEVRIDALHPNGARARRTIRTEPANEVDIGDLVLARGAPVSGRLLLADGTAVANHEVTLRGGVVTDGGLPVVGPDFWYVSMRTDTNGAFTAIRPSDARWSLRVAADAMGLGADVFSSERWFDAQQSHADVVLDAVLVPLAWWDDEGHRLLPAPTSVTVFAAGDGDAARAAQLGGPAAADRSTIGSTFTRAESLLVPPGAFLWLRADTALGSGFDHLVQVPSRATVFPVDLRFEPAAAARIRLVARFADGGVPAELRYDGLALPGASARRFEVLERRPGEIVGVGAVGPVRLRVSAYPEFFDATEEVVEASLVAGGETVIPVTLARRGRIRLWLRDVAAPDRVCEAGDGEIRVGSVRLGRFFAETASGRQHWGSPPLGRVVDARALLPVGEHSLRVDLAEFEPVDVVVTVRDGEPEPTTVWLTRRAH